MGMNIRYITPNELAERWCVLPRTLADLRCKGKGPAYTKIGAKVRYLLEDIEAWERRVSTSDQQ